MEIFIEKRIWFFLDTKAIYTGTFNYLVIFQIQVSSSALTIQAMKLCGLMWSNQILLKTQHLFNVIQSSRYWRHKISSFVRRNPMTWKTDQGMVTSCRVLLLLLNYLFFSPTHLSLLCVLLGDVEVDLRRSFRHGHGNRPSGSKLRRRQVWLVFSLKRKRRQGQNPFFSHLALFLLIPDLVSIWSGAIAPVSLQSGSIGRASR